MCLEKVENISNSHLEKVEVFNSFNSEEKLGKLSTFSEVEENLYI